MEEWINKKYLHKNEIAKIRAEFLAAKPYPHFILENFFKEDKLLNLRNEVLKEKFEHQDKDLFSFSNTKELVASKSRLIKNFYSFFSSEEFMEFISKLTNEKNINKIDMHAHLYRQGDYLLFHDDVVQGRKIAYISYLSKGFEIKDGGRLELYDLKNPLNPAKQIVPNFNSFVCFKVSSKSLHDVEEMKSNKKRLTIGGWFYGN